MDPNQTLALDDIDLSDLTFWARPLEFFGSMINLDDPRHARLRRIVSAAFTPKMIKTFEDQVQIAATRIVDDVIDKGECDFVTEVAARLPLKIICDMMGVPESEYDAVFTRSNVILGATDPEYVPEGGDIAQALLMAGPSWPRWSPSSASSG